MLLRHLVSLGCVLGLVSVTAPSFADAIPPEVADCSSGEAEVGSACVLDKEKATGGTCQATTCHQNDYVCDGGRAADAAPGPCGSIAYACTECIAYDGTLADGGKAPPAPASDAGNDGGSITNGSGSSGGCSTGSNHGADTTSVLVGLAMLAALGLRSRRRTETENT